MSTGNDLIISLNLYYQLVFLVCIYSAAGISRAVTICVMYIMTVSTLTYEEAMTVLQYSRRVAGPNIGFRMQLKKYSRTTLEKV